ncbi:hypothetical protein EG329_003428 [Mollisiaceae sp. DMI_Dod_QoI]|nr:hypothetical protein EG329_003428 [Helotiales sp. DMI_Dod_QoI]
MEFHILPVHRGDPPIQVPRTPYLCTERYDGGPWLSYPARKGKAAKYKAGPFDYLDYARSERLDPTPIKEQESFFQTWLYFGLIAEFLGANCNDPANDPTSNELVKRIYDETLVQDGDQTYVKLDVACLGKFLAMGRARLSPDPLVRRQHYEHVTNCLTYVHPLITTVPKEFNWSVKWSISALGELFTIALRAAFEALQVPSDFSRHWANGFLNDEAKASMREHGWCRSDIARAEAKYQSIQAHYIARMLDKSLPPRDHSQCTDSTCKSYQINLGQYASQHQQLPCSCEQLVVKEESLLPSLSDGDHYPLLQFEGEVDDLTCKIIKSGTKPYIAISHVWADGLGNPHENSLYKCKLHHLRKLVDAINDKESAIAPETAERSLIWLDTLCCPVKHVDGKQKSIEKIRHVYREAKHVLILDAGLMSYDSRSQDSGEIICRIFTSSWMRRLWTLQEGALATSLYFQFADEAVDLSQIIRKAWSQVNSMQHRALLQPDFINELRGISAFFNEPKPLSFADSLNLLDRALQYRSVSVASDEALCIGTLMSLDLHAILELKTQESRMEKVWELILAKHGGIPSQIIFFEQQKLTRPGWRWAPKSLLNSQSGLHMLNTRILRWFDPNLGTREHPHGLRVKYPGIRISFKTADYGDGKPRNPWIGAPRLPEDWIQYRSLDDGYWYRIMDAKLAAITNDDERKAYQAQEPYPLHKIVNTGRSILILNNLPKVREALFATTTTTTTIPISPHETFNEDVPIAVTTQLNTIVSSLKEESHIYNTISQLALSVRADPVTDAHLSLCAKLQIDENTPNEKFKDLLANHEEFIASTANVKAKIKEKLKEMIGVDEKFTGLINRFWGEAYQEHFWVVVRNFFHHDLVGERTGDGQVWFVD